MSTRNFQPRKKKQQASLWQQTQLPLITNVGIYARQSTQNQVKKHIQASEMQTDDLIAFAQRLGWQEEQIILYLENKREDGKIKNASGRLRIDQREGLRSLVQRIEADEIKAVIVFLEDRLFRDETQIQVNVFIEICRQHNTLVITPHMLYDFSNRWHVKQFRARCEEAADYLRDYVIARLNGGKDRASERGLYDGRNIAIGYTVVEKKLVIYEPHARIVRRIFARYFALGGNITDLYRELRREPVLFPPFEATVDKKYIVKCHLEAVPGGYHIGTINGLYALLTNVTYLGWWVYRGEIISKTNHAALITDEALFWYAFNRLSAYTPDGERNTHKKQLVRYQRANSPHCPSLLKTIIVSSDKRRSIYVSFAFDTWYYLSKCREYIKHDDSLVARLPVADLDRFYTQRLCSYLRHTEAFTQYQQFKEKEQAAKREEVTSIDAQLTLLTQQIQACEANLDLPPGKLSTERRTHYAERLTQLEKDQASIQEKLAALSDPKQTKAVEKLMEFHELAEEIEAFWEKFSLEDKRLIIEDLTERVTLFFPTAHFAIMTITWRMWGEDTGIIWRPKGSLHFYTEEENALVREHYPTTDRETLLTLLPKRSWYSIKTQARKLGITRPSIHERIITPLGLSLEDWRFMQEHGITTDMLSPDTHLIWSGPSGGTVTWSTTTLGITRRSVAVSLEAKAELVRGKTTR